MDDVASQFSVQTWLADYARHWGPNTPDVRAKLVVLGEFCKLVGKAPDAIVQECLRDVDAGKRIKLKARRRYIEAIREFETQHSNGRTAGNVVRSFFIHNGVAMSPDVPGF
jgi:hypothetical protein